MRKLLSFILTLTMLIGLAPMVAFEADAASYDVINEHGVTGKDIVDTARTYIGIPYDTSGGNYKYRTGFGDTMMFDCSGFVYRVCRDVGLASSRKNYTMGQTDNDGNPLEGQDSNGNYYITAHTHEQRYYGTDLSDNVATYKKTQDYSVFQPGDLLFFDTNGNNTTDHVAIYTESGKMIHSEGGSGVNEESISSYYRNILFDACRLVEHADISHIEDSYPCHVRIRITSSTAKLKSLPCSKNTDPQSIDVEAAAKDAVYIAIGLVLNDQGNLWYKVESRSDEIGYIYAGDAQYIGHETDDLKLSNPSIPIEIKEGAPFSVKGIISTDYQKLANITVWVESVPDGELQTHKTIEIDTNRYDLSSKEMDYNLKFDELKAGEYSYLIGVAVKTYYAKNAKEVATATADLMLHESTFSVVKDTTCKHSYSSKVTEPTYTSQGYTTYTCTKCGDSYKGDYTDALVKKYQITFDANGGTLPAAVTTHTLDGINVAREAGALVVYNNSGALVNTNEYGVEVVVDANNKVIGKREYESDTKQHVPSGGFVLSSHGGPWNFLNVAEIGYYVAYDENKMQVYIYDSQEAFAANHKYVTIDQKIGKMPVPTREGYTFRGWYTAKEDGYLITEEHCIDTDWTLYAQWTSAHTHEWSEGIVTKAATCTAEGVLTYTCACGGTKTEAIAATGHSFGDWVTVVAPTAETEGKAERKCACGETESKTLDKTMGFNITVASKSVAGGQTVAIEISVLSYMPKIKSMIIQDIAYDTELLEFVSAEIHMSEALIADWDDAAKVATIAFAENTEVNGTIMRLIFKAKEGAEGTSSISCDIRANQLQPSGKEAKIALTVVPGTVTVTSVLRGDVNGDGYVNSNDAIYLLRYTLSPSRYPINQNGDMNGDSYVNSDDAIYLLRYTLSPSRYPLH